MNCLRNTPWVSRRRFVFLSGDVHYAYNAVGWYKRRGGAHAIEIVQLTSSSLKNAMSGVQSGAGHILGLYSDSSVHRWLARDRVESGAHLFRKIARPPDSLHADIERHLAYGASDGPPEPAGSPFIDDNATHSAEYRFAYVHPSGLADDVVRTNNVGRVSLTRTPRAGGTSVSVVHSLQTSTGTTHEVTIDFDSIVERLRVPDAAEQAAARATWRAHEVLR